MPGAKKVVGLRVTPEEEQQLREFLGVVRSGEPLDGGVNDPSPGGTRGGVNGGVLTPETEGSDEGPVVAPELAGFADEPEERPTPRGRSTRLPKELEGWEAYAEIVSKLPLGRYDTAREAVLQYLTLWGEGARGAFHLRGTVGVTSPSLNDLMFERDVRGRLDETEISALLAMPQPIARALYLDLTVGKGTGLRPKRGVR